MVLIDVTFAVKNYFVAKIVYFSEKHDGKKTLLKFLKLYSVLIYECDMSYGASENTSTR